MWQCGNENYELNFVEHCDAIHRYIYFRFVLSFIHSLNYKWDKHCTHLYIWNVFMKWKILTCSSLSHQIVGINNWIGAGCWQSGIFQFELLQEDRMYDDLALGFIMWSIRILHWYENLFTVKKKIDWFWRDFWCDLGMIEYLNKNVIKSISGCHSACDVRIKKKSLDFLFVQY